jgi:hypothetical protein
VIKVEKFDSLKKLEVHSFVDGGSMTVSTSVPAFCINYGSNPRPEIHLDVVYPSCSVHPLVLEVCSVPVINVL